MGYCTRGTRSGSSLPVSVSKKCNTPSSLPFFERHTATRSPSGDGTYQSMAVVPFVSYLFRSRIVFGGIGRLRLVSEMSTGCCCGGLNLSAKTMPVRCVSPE